MSELRVGVVGLGSMGMRHAEALSRLSGVRLAAGATRDAERRRQAQETWHIFTTADYRELVDYVDAVTIAAPTYLHAEIAEYFLHAGKHVLVEKPIAATKQEAARLVALAEERSDVCFMVGHLERFNPAFIRLAAAVKANWTSDTPVRIEAYRLGPYDGRIQDVCVVLDLMIHDVDLVAALHPGRSWNIRQALGMSVVTERTDIAMAEYEWTGNGMVPAHVKLLASRTHDMKRRVIEVQAGNFAGRADLLNQRVWLGHGGRDVTEVQCDRGSALALQLAHFVASVRSGTQPAVTARMAKQALDLCLDIVQRI